MELFTELKDTFYLCFIDDNRFVDYMLTGLGVTLEITLFAVLIGLAIGVMLALIRATHDKTIDSLQPGPARLLLKFLNLICKIYITVIRGVPVVVQLMIWFFVILITIKNGIVVAVIGFGINSGAYVAEIIRAGIMSVDHGQMEAGRSLGLSYISSMRYIILPQALKNVLPALLNEFIALLKETAVVGYIATTDMTKGAYIIVGRTFEAFMPLVAAALIYLAIVMLLSSLFGKLERRLRASDRR